jgi:hypothetical protein
MQQSGGASTRKTCPACRKTVVPNKFIKLDDPCFHYLAFMCQVCRRPIGNGAELILHLRTFHEPGEIEVFNEAVASKDYTRLKQSAENAIERAWADSAKLQSEVDRARADSAKLQSEVDILQEKLRAAKAQPAMTVTELPVSSYAVTHLRHTGFI